MRSAKAAFGNPSTSSPASGTDRRRGQKSDPGSAVTAAGSTAAASSRPRPRRPWSSQLPLSLFRTHLRSLSGPVCGSPAADPGLRAGGEQRADGGARARVSHSPAPRRRVLTQKV
ncbi:Hypothetical predicted protein [Marmota monax]|uniref:Uncharacterized protein n=1 Tax=Marmota monax TaxID=9995 RepID=A0A5E4BXT3_MARMO|nr:Hypothetical predicted protein [Marmota monax]